MACVPEKFVYADATSFDEADVILYGVPDESGSHAHRKGASKGPEAFRRVARERYQFERDGKPSIVKPQHCPLHHRIFDGGDLGKGAIKEAVAKAVAANKFPLLLGGDHSLTFNALEGFPAGKKLSVVYFDAHPDFVCSSNRYYGSVVCDAGTLSNVLLSRSFEIGNRALEEEEIANRHASQIRVVSPFQVQGEGVQSIYKEMDKVLTEHVYLSIDLDVLDPAFAPGVGTPVPGGLTTRELVYLCKKLAHRGLVGFDVMELSPPNDVQDATADVAVMLVLETLACLKR